MRVSTSVFRNGLLATVLIGILFFCNCQAIGNPAEQGKPLAVSTVATFANVPAFTSPTNFAVLDQSGWDGLWAQVTQSMYPAPPQPAIDFTKNVVIFAAAGTKATSGYAIAITSATETSAGVSVDVTITSPGTCPVSQVVTSPVVIATIPRRDTTIGFSVSTKVQSC